MSGTNRGSWKNGIAGVVTGLAMVVVTTPALFGAREAAASVIPSGFAKGGCQSQLSNVFLAGSFTLTANSRNKMSLWVGRGQGGSAGAKGVVGLLGAEGGSCEAVCRVIRFERYRRDFKPALMELECEGSRIRTMRMPVHVQWTASGTVVRLGSSIYGMEQAPLKVSINRYTVASK